VDYSSPLIDKNGVILGKSFKATQHHPRLIQHGFGIPNSNRCLPSPHA
jgi:hypothetical protein